MDANLIVQMIRSGAFNPGNIVARGFGPQRDLANVIRRDAVPVAETEEDVQRLEGTYRAPPPFAATETGVRSLERRMNPEMFHENGTPRSYPMADAMADHPSSTPASENPLTLSVRPRPRPQTAQAPMPPRRPPAHSAPANPGPPQAAPQAPQTFDGGDGWIPPDQGDAQNQALQQASASGAAGPQFAQTPTAYASGSGGGVSTQNPPPGSGLMAFLNSGAVPVFKQADVGPSDWQGPVLPHENTGKRVGVVEGSVAHNFQESPMGKLAGLFGMNPFGM